MSIISQALLPYATTLVAAGTSAQQVQVNAAGTLAGVPAGNFVLPIPAEVLVGLAPITIKAQGYITKGVTSTVSIGFTWGKTIAGATAAMFTQVASASLTGANPPLVANTFPWQMEQKLILDAASQTASAFGPGGGASAGATTGGIWVGAAGVAISAGVPPTQLTGVTYNPTLLLPTGGTVLPTLANAAIYIGISFTNATSDTTALGQFVITNFVAVQD